jgi:hypothetical protein
MELYELSSDPLIWEQNPDKNRYQKEKFRLFFRDALNSKGALVVVDYKKCRLIGSSRYHGYHKERSEIKIGWTFLMTSYN